MQRLFNIYSDTSFSDRFLQSMKHGSMVLLVSLVLATQNQLYASQSLEDDPDDPPIVFSDSLFFVWLQDGLLPDTINALSMEFFASRIWSDDDIDLELWKVDSFPVITPDLDTLVDINEVIRKSRQKTKIRDATNDIQQTQIGAPNNQPLSSCFDFSEFDISHGGMEMVKISILDTGISDITDNGTQYDTTLITTRKNYVDNTDPWATDDHGHGSHLMGIIHEITHQVTTINNSLITYDIRKTHNAQGQAFISALVIGLMEAVDDGADIVNMSFSFNDMYADTSFFPLKLAMEDAREEGVLIIAAAANDGLDNDNLQNTALPASFPLDNIISVASVNCMEALSDFSNYGAKNVDIAVFGEDIPGPDLGTGIVGRSGTSQATAIITGVAALYATHLPEFDAAQIKCAILESARHVVAMGDKATSDGLLNFDAGFALLGTCTPSDQCSEDFTGAQALSGSTDTGRMLETNLGIESAEVLINQSHHTYDASLGTTLQPGFEVQAGTQFQILSSGCQD